MSETDSSSIQDTGSESSFDKETEYDNIKYDWHGNKHTLRYKSNWRYKTLTNNTILECQRNTKHKDLVPVTSIDEYFDDNFLKINEYKNDCERSLNKSYQWDNITTSLENSSEKIIKKWNPSEGVVYKTFSVPVEKYVLKESIKKKSNLDYLRWNNDYYDPKYIYTYIGDESDTCGKLQKYCLNEWNSPEIENMKVISKNTFIKKKIKNKKLVQPKECYHDIDLGSVQHIQYIVTFGKYPNKRVFPKRKSKYGYSYIDKSKPYVYVLENPANDSYVKKFSVSYKDIITNKWISYKELDGNQNSHTPKINNVDVYTRYIRIKPLEYVKSKSMIIYLYSFDKKNDSKEINNIDDEEEEELVKYTLIPPITNNIRNDGYGERCYSPDWIYQQYHKEERKRKIKEMLDEQLEDL